MFARPMAMCSLIKFVLGLAQSVTPAQSAADKEPPPITGKAVPRMKQLDRVMQDILHTYRRPSPRMAGSWPLLREAIQKIDKWPAHDLFVVE